MTHPAATAQRACTHDAALYGSDDEYLAVAVPFIRGGIEADEPTLVAAHSANEKLLRKTVEQTPAVEFLDGVAEYQQPASAIRTLLALGKVHFNHGARRVRILSEVAQPFPGRPWEWWARYEAVINQAFGDVPLQLRCPYDTRITPDEVLTDVVHTHPRLCAADGRATDNPDFQCPERFIAARRPGAGAEPLEAGAPDIELVNPSSSQARHAIRDAGAGTGLDADEIDEYAGAVSEAVTNALRHGRPAVRMRTWRGPDRVVNNVTDEGPGPADSLVGLLPPTRSSGGHVGLWLTHQMCSHVTLGRDEYGFTVRLVRRAAGRP